MNYDSPAACGTFLGIACLSTSVALIALAAIAAVLVIFYAIRRSKKDLVS